MIRILVAAVLLMLGACATNAPPLVVGYDFLGGPHATLLRETFGKEEVESGVAFYVLPNPWAPVAPNGLLLTAGRARYVWVDRLGTHKLDVNVDSCEGLQVAMDKLAKALSSSMDHASEREDYPDPEYFDGPDYVLEIREKNANLLIQPKGLPENFPAVTAALDIAWTARSCHDS